MTFQQPCKDTAVDATSCSVFVENAILQPVCPHFSVNIKVGPTGGFEVSFAKGDETTTRKMLSWNQCYRWLVEVHAGEVKDKPKMATAACLQCQLLLRNIFRTNTPISYIYTHTSIVRQSPCPSGGHTYGQV